MTQDLQLDKVYRQVRDECATTQADGNRYAEYVAPHIPHGRRDRIPSASRMCASLFTLSQLEYPEFSFFLAQRSACIAL
jgi:hypothetical protein